LVSLSSSGAEWLYVKLHFNGVLQLSPQRETGMKKTSCQENAKGAGIISYIKLSMQGGKGVGKYIHPFDARF
jgi:hypothetical protein